MDAKVDEILGRLPLQMNLFQWYKTYVCYVKWDEFFPSTKRGISVDVGEN